MTATQTYRLTAPDGSTYRVTAPQGATEAEVLRYAQSQHRAPSAPRQPAAPAKRSGWQTVGDFIGDVSDNILPNWGDELYAAGAATRAWMDGRDAGQAFRDGQARFRRNQAEYDRAHPKAAWGSTITGVLSSTALPAGRLASGAGKAAKLAQGAKVGALYGALSGAGEGESVGDRAANATSGAAKGAVIGAAMTPALQAVALGGRLARQNVPGVEPVVRALANVPRAVMRKSLLTSTDSAHANADRFLAGKLRQGHIATGMGQQGARATPETLMAEQERRQAIGVPAVLGDMTDGLRGVTSWASRGAGPGQTLVRQRLDARKAQEAQRVRQHIVSEMGEVVDPILQAEQHAARAKAQAAPLYQAAYAEPMVLTPEIEGIMRTPAFQEAVPHAVRNIRNAQRDPTGLGFRLDADGNITGAQTLTTEGFDQVIRAMRDSGRAAMDHRGFRPQNTTNSVHINARANDLRQHLSDHNRAYGDAVRLYGDEMAQRDALQAGQDFAKLTGAEVAAQGRSIPDGAREAWSIGVRSALADDASAYGAANPTGDVAGRLRRALGDEQKQAALGELTGNTGAVRGLQDRLEAEQQANVLWKEVRGNSATAGRQALDADLNAETIGRTLSSLTPRGMARRIIDEIGSRATASYRNEVKARVAQIVTETNPATVRELMAEIAARAAKDREFAGLLHRGSMFGSKVAAANIIPENVDEEVADGGRYSPEEVLGDW